MYIDYSLSLPQVKRLCDLLERNDHRARSLKSANMVVPHVCISGETRGTAGTEAVMMDISTKTWHIEPDPVGMMPVITAFRVEYLAQVGNEKRDV